jgi:hypothetical protein
MYMSILGMYYYCTVLLLPLGCKYRADRYMYMYLAQVPSITASVQPHPLLFDCLALQLSAYLDHPLV